MSKKPPVPDEDWLEEILNVSPLKGRKSAVKRVDTEAVEDFSSDCAGNDNFPIEKQEDNAPIKECVNQNSHFKNQQVDVSSRQAEKLAGALPTMDAKNLKKLSRGDLSPTMRVDLHGMVLDDAWAACMDFLHTAQKNGHKCVLVIHGKGKGYGPNGDMGVIKAQMADWLSSHPAVMAFHTARPQHGGAGAVYVLLRKLK